MHPFLLYRKLRRISYKAKKRSAWIALRRNRICRFATRRRRRILRCRILFLHEKELWKSGLGIRGILRLLDRLDFDRVCIAGLAIDLTAGQHDIVTGF